MADKEQKTAQGESKPTGGDAGVAEVQRSVDAENERGYVGVKVDPTPNEAYTLAGVAAGQPTPETDPATAAAVRDRQYRLARGEAV